MSGLLRLSWSRSRWRGAASRCEARKKRATSHTKESSRWPKLPRNRIRVVEVVLGAMTHSHDTFPFHVSRSFAGLLSLFTFPITWCLAGIADVDLDQRPTVGFLGGFGSGFCIKKAKKIRFWRGVGAFGRVFLSDNESTKNFNWIEITK